MIYTKIDENTIGVTKTTPQQITPAKIEEKEYAYDFLLKQRDQIQRDYNRDAATLALRQVELDEINTLITEADKLGIKSSDKFVSEQIGP